MPGVNHTEYPPTAVDDMSSVNILNATFAGDNVSVNNESDSDYLNVSGVNILNATIDDANIMECHNFVINDDEVPEENNEDNQNYIQQQVQANTYTIIPGNRLKSQIYMDNLNYKYHKHSTHNNKIYLRCENQKNYAEYCPAIGKISTNGNNHSISISRRHNHLPSNVDIPMAHLRRAIGLAATQTGRMSDSVRRIYSVEIVRNSEGAYNYTFQQIRHCINRMLSSCRSSNPRTMEKFSEMLQEPQNRIYSSTLQRPPSRFFQEQLFAHGETVGVVFANLDAIQIYNDVLLSCTIAGARG